MRFMLTSLCEHFECQVNFKEIEGVRDRKDRDVGHPASDDGIMANPLNLVRDEPSWLLRSLSDFLGEPNYLRTIKVVANCGGTSPSALDRIQDA
jgi:hypothetical protein